MNFNIELFKIPDTKTKHNNFLIFIIKKIYWKEYNWKINRSQFIEKWIIKFWYKRKTIEQFFDKGIKDNNYILEERDKRWKKYYYIKTFIDKAQPFNIKISIPKEVIEKVVFISDFYTLSFAIVASRLLIVEEWIKKYEYNKVRWRTLRTIWKLFWWLAKNTVSYHLSKALIQFKGFKNNPRYKVYNNYICRISNIYFFYWIGQNVIKNPKMEWKKTEKTKTTFILEHSQKSYFFWNWKNIEWFLPEYLYEEEDFYKNLIKN